MSQRTITILKALGWAALLVAVAFLGPMLKDYKLRPHPEQSGKAEDFPSLLTPEEQKNLPLLMLGKTICKDRDGYSVFWAGGKATYLRTPTDERHGLLPMIANSEAIPALDGVTDIDTVRDYCNGRLSQNRP